MKGQRLFYDRFSSKWDTLKTHYYECLLKGIGIYNEGKHEKKSIADGNGYDKYNLGSNYSPQTEPGNFCGV